MATDTISLDFIAAQLSRVLDEQRGLREEQRGIRRELRSLVENQAGMLRLIDKLADRIEQQREDLMLSIKIEIGGLFANLETRLENRIAGEIEARLGDRPH